MRYLALGDSISIDDYTGIDGGGAASRLALLLGAEHFDYLAYDGCTTAGVIALLESISDRPDVITLTAGGNDFLQGAYSLTAADAPDTAAAWDRVTTGPLLNLHRIAARLSEHRCAVILNTIYDPTDGDDALASELAIPISFRAAFQALNRGIRALAASAGFHLCDLEALFRGHGLGAADTWYVSHIEPGREGAHAIGQAWYELLVQAGELPDGARADSPAA